MNTNTHGVTVQKRIGLPLGFGLSLLLLTGCSNTHKVCNKEGTCLEMWSIVTATSSVSVAQLRTAKDTPVVGTTVTITGGGIVGDIDPLAQSMNQTASEARLVTGF